MRVLIAVLITLGCVAPKPQVDLDDPVAVHADTTCERDPFRKSVICASRAYLYDGGFDATSYATSLTATLEADRTIFALVASVRHGGDWHHYTSAYDSGGNELVMSRGKVDVDCARVRSCTYSENAIVVLERESLRTLSDGGFQLKLYGRGGSQVISLPEAMVGGFLERVEQEESRRRE